MLCVCYFWDDFRIHANDIYHRYITNDVNLAIEVAENHELANPAKNSIETPPMLNTMMVMFQRHMESQSEERKWLMDMQRQHMDLQRQQIEDQKEERRQQFELQRQQVEDQKEERRQQFELQKQQLEAFKTAIRPTPVNSPPRRAASNGEQVDAPRPQTQSQKDSEGFKQFLRQFFPTRPNGRMTVGSIMEHYNAYARANHLNQFTTRMKLVRTLNAVSTRMIPIKHDGRISGWSW